MAGIAPWEPRPLSVLGMAGAIMIWLLAQAGLFFPSQPAGPCGRNDAPQMQAGSAYAFLFFQPMDLNRASLEELTLLPGVGPARAAQVIGFRQAAGFLVSVDELDVIDGPLPPRILGGLRPFLGVGARIAPGS